MVKEIKKEITIYLSGSIKKGKGDALSSFWIDKDEKYLGENIQVSHVRILNPAKANIKRGNPMENFGADLYLVRKSDFVLVDFRERRGIGVGSEITLAKYYKIPVISICPKESHYRRSKVKDVCGEDLHDWIHPFVLGWSDGIVENLKEAVDWINTYLRNPRPVKDFKIIEDSIRLYVENQLGKAKANNGDYR